MIELTSFNVRFFFLLGRNNLTYQFVDVTFNSVCLAENCPFLNIRNQDQLVNFLIAQRNDTRSHDYHMMRRLTWKYQLGTNMEM